MAGNGPGIYFNHKTKEVVSVNGHEEDFDLKGWVRVSDDPTLRLLVVRELLLEKGLIRDDRAVYWSGFRGSASEQGAAVGFTLPVQTARERELKSTPRRRGNGSAVQRLLRSILGSRTTL